MVLLCQCRGRSIAHWFGWELSIVSYKMVPPFGYIRFHDGNWGSFGANVVGSVNSDHGAFIPILPNALKTLIDYYESLYMSAIFI